MDNKKYKAVKAKVPTDIVSIEEAVTFLQANKRATFDETVELHVHLAIDSKKSDQMVRGTVSLPAGAAKQRRVAVLATRAEDQKAAQEAGAALVGGEELIKQIADTGKLDADIVIATPDMMPKIASVARILGPQGLMPNPKTGTVTPKPAEAVKELAGGKLSFKMDQLGNIHEAVAKISWEAEKITQNVEALLEAIKAAKPATVKGSLIRSVSVKTTMSPAVKVNK